MRTGDNVARYFGCSLIDIPLFRVLVDGEIMLPHVLERASYVKVCDKTRTEQNGKGAVLDPVQEPSQNRSEFRELLRNLVSCLRTELNVPGVTPFDPEDLRQWFQSITAEDIRAVWDDDHGKDCT